MRQRWSNRPAVVLLLTAALAISGGSGCEDPAPVAPAIPSPVPIVATPTPSPTANPPSPTPEPTAASCPPLTSWSSKIHNITNAQHQQVGAPVVGGYVVVDSTPLFNGRPCNAEHNHCGGRKCEDPRGANWWLHEGGSPTEERGDGYQFRIGPLVAGYHRWRVCPRSDAQDAEGQPVLVGWGSCTQGDFTVPVP